MDILGYILDILGYFLDKYEWISLMDMWLGYLWICLDISRISPVDIFSWISLQDILFCPKISKRYPFISNNIQRYPEISRDIQRYPNGANSQMPGPIESPWNPGDTDIGDVWTIIVTLDLTPPDDVCHDEVLSLSGLSVE